MGKVLPETNFFFAIKGNLSYYICLSEVLAHLAIHLAGHCAPAPLSLSHSLTLSLSLSLSLSLF